MHIRHTVKRVMNTTANSHFGHALTEERGDEFRVAAVGDHPEGLFLQWKMHFDPYFYTQKIAFLYSPSVELKLSLCYWIATGDHKPLLGQVLKEGGWVANGPIRPSETQEPTSRADLSEFCALVSELQQQLEDGAKQPNPQLKVLHMHLIEKQREDGDGRKLPQRQSDLFSEAVADKSRYDHHTLWLLVRVVELLEEKGLLTSAEVLEAFDLDCQWEVVK